LKIEKPDDDQNREGEEVIIKIEKLDDDPEEKYFSDNEAWLWDHGFSVPITSSQAMGW
jgi:hypothetical protein